MSAAQNLGGFRIPDDDKSATPATDLLAPPQAPRAPSPQSNNPYFQHLTGQEQLPNNSHLSPYPEASSSYPSYAPPAYDVATSPVPSPVDSKNNLGSHQSMNSGARSFGDSQPSQMSRSPHASQAPIEYGVAGPSQPPMQPQPSSSLLDQAKSQLAPRDPLDPPPPCFGRVILPPSPTTTYERLSQPFVIHGKPGKKYLDDAFPTTGTPAFYKHDILAEDWVRFLEDIQIVARLTGGQRVVAGVLPVTMHIGFAGFFVSRAIQNGMKKKNTGNVSGLLDIWNERFFKPRQLEVILCRGDYRESGNNLEAPAPDRPHAHPRQRHASGSLSPDSSSSDSDSSDSEDDHSNMGRKQIKSQRRTERRQRKHERREDRRERREERRARRDIRRTEKRNTRKGNEKPYRLVVVSV